MKTVSVRVNGSLAEAIGSSRLTVQLPPGATLAELMVELEMQYPSSKALLSRAVAMAGGKHAGPSTVLPEEQEIALLMPIAGG